MKKLSIDEANKNLRFNQKRAKKYPEIQKEFLDEYMYSNPNDFEEMTKLYEYYGYKYSRSLWALHQLEYNEANEATQRRLKNDKLHQ